MRTDLNTPSQQVLDLLNEAQSLMQLGVWEWDLIKGTYLCSDYILQFLSAEKMNSPTDFLTQIAEPDKKLVKDFLELVQETPQVQFPTLEYRVLKQGQPHWVSSRFKLYLDAQQQPHRLVGTLQDIQHQHILQEQANKQQQLREAVLTSSKDGFMMASLDGYILELNQRFSELTGLSHDDLVGQHVSAWSTELGRLVNHLSLTLQQQRPSLIEIQLNSQSPITDLEANVSVCEYGSDKRLICFFRDITQRKAMQQALRVSESRLKAATETAQIGIWEQNLTTGKSYVSSIMQSLNGFILTPPLTDQSKTLAHRVHPDDIAEFLDLQTQMAARKQVLKTSFRLRQNDSSYRYLSVMGEYHQRGDQELYIGSAWDITQEKEVQQAIQEANESLEQRVQERTLELESANLAKSRFLANMSHEIRTPMNVILGFADLMVQDASLSEMAQYRLESIRNSGQHLLSLISDILEVSKIEAGRVELNPAALDFHRLLQDIQRMFRDAALKKGITFSFEMSPETPRYIYIDETKIREILFNLIGNAVKFTKIGGIHLSVGFESANQNILAKVTDTGFGISSDEQKLLFKPFEQTTSGRQIHKGTGLGLTICREYLTLMGGDIQVQSELGVGTTFSFRFPFEPVLEDDIPQALPSQKVIGLASGQGPVSVLIVDDHEDNRYLLMQILSPLGFELMEAVDGRDALQKIEQYTFNVVLMDLAMPEMDGLEAIRELRQRGYTDLPVIAVTANAFEENRQEVFKVGGNGFVGKPFRRQEILKQLNEVAQISFEYEKPQSFEIPQEDLPAAIMLPDEEWLHRFRVALASFEPDQVEEQISQIAASHPTFYKKIEPWTREFRYPELEDWLQSLN